MSAKSRSGAPLVGAVILLIVSAANIGYGLYRMSQGENDNAALFIGGTMCGALAAILLSMRKKAARDD